MKKQVSSISVADLGFTSESVAVGSTLESITVGSTLESVAVGSTLVADHSSNDIFWLRLSNYFNIVKMEYKELLCGSIAFSKRLRAEQSVEQVT